MFKTNIGLEVHVQLKTKSKMFCSCDNNAQSAEPNSLVCPVCLGLPGVLPVPNQQAIEWTLKTGLALNSTISDLSKFDRKHYFYPDLPKNYQISQYDMPFCEGGYLDVANSENSPTGGKKINLQRIHLEEDAGKLIHSGKDSLVDFNRAGTPLMEIVTEPEINSPSEARLFIQELRAILRYLDVSEADMEKGHLRCDANISLRPTADSQQPLGTPVEIKNMNSFRMIEKALLFEEKRQRELLEKGEKIIKETRGWNDEEGITYSQRGKEYVFDYRYFPEPDIPPFTPGKFNLEIIKKEIPELAAAKRARFIKDFGLKMQDASVLVSDISMVNYFEKVAKVIEPKLCANWLINELGIEGISKVTQENFQAFLRLLSDDEINGRIAKEILVEMKKTGKAPAEVISQKGIKQVGDETEIGTIVDKVIETNPGPVADFRKGKSEAMGYLIGLVMRETRGQANPQIVNKVLRERLESKK